MTDNFKLSSDNLRDRDPHGAYLFQPATYGSDKRDLMLEVLTVDILQGDHCRVHYRFVERENQAVLSATPAFTVEGDFPFNRKAMAREIDSDVIHDMVAIGGGVAVTNGYAVRDFTRELHTDYLAVAVQEAFVDAKELCRWLYSIEGFSENVVIDAEGCVMTDFLSAEEDEDDEGTVLVKARVSGSVEVTYESNGDGFEWQEVEATIELVAIATLSVDLNDRGVDFIELEDDDSSVMLQGTDHDVDAFFYKGLGAFFKNQDLDQSMVNASPIKADVIPFIEMVLSNEARSLNQLQYVAGLDDGQLPVDFKINLSDEDEAAAFATINPEANAYKFEQAVRDLVESRRLAEVAKQNTPPKLSGALL